MARARVRIALMGLRGVNAGIFAPAVRACSSAELVTGVDPSDEARQAFTAESKLPAYATLAEALKVHALDAIVIGSPNPAHLPNIREAAAARLHMLVTKPLCNTVAECREAIALAAEAGVVLQTGHEYRFRPAVRRIIDLARAGHLGQLSMVTGHLGHAGGLDEAFSGPGQWRHNPANCPGGCANLLGVHQIDVAIAILGVPVQVHATLRHLCAVAPIDDTAVITLTHPRGVSVCTSSYASLPADEMRVLGTAANGVVSNQAAYLESSNARSPVKDLPASSAANVLIEQLVAAVDTGKAVQTTGHTGLLNVAVVEAAITSSRLGRSVAMHDILTNYELRSAAV
jgi:predicted dehydrogenase